MVVTWWIVAFLPSGDPPGWTFICSSRETAIYIQIMAFPYKRPRLIQSPLQTSLRHKLEGIRIKLSLSLTKPSTDTIKILISIKNLIPGEYSTSMNNKSLELTTFFHWPLFVDYFHLLTTSSTMSSSAGEYVNMGVLLESVELVTRLINNPLTQERHSNQSYSTLINLFTFIKKEQVS